MASVARTLARIKEDLQPFLPEESILSACRDARHRWRQRKLGPVQTIQLFIVQVLCLNTAMTALRHVGDKTVKAPAYCKARMRLPLKVLQALLVTSSASMRGACQLPATLFCGLRTFLADGSSTIAPDTPDSQEAFGQPTGCKKGCGFPVPKVLGLFDAFSGLVVQTLGFPLFTHEQSKVWLLHPLLGSGDLLVGDRGFCSFVHLAMLALRGVHGLFRMHQKQIVDFRPHRKHRRRKQKKGKGRLLPLSKFIKRLGRHDQIVQWLKPKQRPKWMSRKQYSTLPGFLRVREVRFTIAAKGQRTREVTIATTLLDPLLYPKEKIAELYGVRWQVETHFAELKTTLRMRKVKSRTAQGVLKELVIYALVYNLVRLAMLRAAERQKVEPDRISFIDALRWLSSACPGEPLADLVTNPRRKDRHEPRVVKDIPDTYAKMRRPRADLRKALRKQAKGA
jgi:Transposase DDE domain